MRKKSNQIIYLISRIRFHILHTILTANLVVISACHYIKEKTKTFQVLLHLNTSYSVRITAAPTSVCLCVCGRKKRWYVKSKTLGSICWFYLGIWWRCRGIYMSLSYPIHSVFRHLSLCCKISSSENS